MAQSVQQPELEPISLLPKDEDEALAILQGELQSQATTFSQDGAMKMADASRYLESRVITNETMRAPVRQSVTVPKGAPFTVQGKNIRVRQNETGETVIESIEPQPQRIYSDPATIAKNVVESTTPQKQTNKFDIEESFKRLGTLSGDDYTDFARQTLANIETQIATEMKRVRLAAGMESGYSDKQAAYQRNVQLDLSTGFVARYGFASGETVIAQNEMAQASILADRLTTKMLADDAELRRLGAAKYSLLQQQQREERKEDAAIRAAASKTDREETAKTNRKMMSEQRIEDLASRVSNAELANYRFAYGNDSRPDNIVKADIATQATNDKVLAAIIKIDPANIHTYLMSSDQVVRSKALQVFEGYERANNAALADKTNTTAPMTEKLKKLFKDPRLEQKLLEFATKEEKASLLRDEVKATGQEKAAVKAQYYPNLLARYLEKDVEKDVVDDVNKWKAGFSSDNPFMKVVSGVSSSNPKKVAPLGSVVDAFITMKVPGPDGKELAFTDKVKIMEAAITQNMNNTARSLISTPATLDAVQKKTINAMKIQAARTYIRNAGGNYLYAFGYTGHLVKEKLEAAARGDPLLPEFVTDLLKPVK